MKQVKDMEPAERAERVLRQRLAKEKRYYGMIGKVATLEYGGVDDGYHSFFVTFDDGQAGVFEVKLYSKSARVYRG